MVEGAAAAFEREIHFALELGVGEFELKYPGLWLDECMRIMEKYAGVEWEWSYVNNWGRVNCKLGRG